MSKYRKTMAQAMNEGAIQMQIATLKKAYEPMRNKRISLDNANKLSQIFNRFDSNKEMLKQLYKADIPFVSAMATSRLISKHNMKAQELMQIRKEGIETSTDELKQINEHFLSEGVGHISGFRNDKEKANMISLAKQHGLKIDDSGSKLKLSGNMRKILDMQLAAQRNGLKAEEVRLSLDEAKFTDQQIKMAYGIANDPRYKQGNYSGAVSAIEKIAKGLSSHPAVQNVLKRTNENLDEGKMSQIDQMQKDGKSAAEIAKLMKLDVKTVKSILGEEEKLHEFKKMTVTFKSMADMAKASTDLAKHGFTIDAKGMVMKVDGKGADLNKYATDLKNFYKASIRAESYSIDESADEDFYNPVTEACWTGYKQVGMKDKGGKQVPNCVPEETVKEDKDHEISMARGELEAIADKATKLSSMLQGKSDEGNPLEAWVQSKITKAKDYINSVTDYVEYNPDMANEAVDDKKKMKKTDVEPENDAVEKNIKEEDDPNKLSNELKQKENEIAQLKQKAETEKAKNVQKSTQKMVNPETGEPLLQVGIAYQHLKAKMAKDAAAKDDAEEKEKLDKKKLVAKFKDRIKESLNLDESDASDKAKSMGLSYMKFGRYGKDGKVTHKSIGGNLTAVDKNEKPNKAPKSDKPKDEPKKDEPKAEPKPALDTFQAQKDLEDMVTDGMIDVEDDGQGGVNMTKEYEPSQDYEADRDVKAIKDYLKDKGIDEKDILIDVESEDEYIQINVEVRGKKMDEMAKDKAYAIGMATAKKKYNDEPPLDKKTIKKGHEIGDKLSKMKNEDHPAKKVFEQIEGLKNKAEKSGMPYSILKKVYDRGMAAWRGGHRPGASQQQWAFARVNSFITKSSGTWGGADKDLAAKVKGK